MDSKEQIKDEVAADEVCANCGKAEVDEINLKKCTYNLVKYCSVECQKNHRPQHKTACKQRMAEKRDDKLFTQPDESHLGECPICCLPLPLDIDKWGINSCCCKRLCNGCTYANALREREQGLEQKCPFCREPVPKSMKAAKQNYVVRAKANDPVALMIWVDSAMLKGITKVRLNHSSSTYLCQTQIGHERGIWAIEAFLQTIYGGELTSIAPPLPHEATSSTIATQS